MNDLRFAFRQLLKNPGFTAVGVLTLAICIGANLTIFAVMDSVLLRPLPFPEADRLVTIFNSYPKAGVERDGSTLPNYYERRGNIPGFSSLSLFRQEAAIVGEVGSTEQEDILRVSPEFFATLRLGPVMGRAFTEEETIAQSDGVAILTDASWRQRFNADPNILGRQIRVDGLQKVIVGVLPPGFRFLSSKARLFLPLSSNPEDRKAQHRHSSDGCEMIARLKPDVALSVAQSQIDAHNAAHAAEFSGAKIIADAGFHTVVTGLHADHVKSIRATLVLMQAGVLILLLIGAVNLVNLLLIRATGRARESALRQALGASGWDVVRQVMTETVVLTLVGGLFGLAVGVCGTRVLDIVGVYQLPLGAHVAFDGRVALVALLGTFVLGIAVALPIAWFNLRGQQVSVLQSGSRGGTASSAAQHVRQGFIIAQIALAFVLLAGAGLLGISLKRAMEVSPGFRPDHMLTGQMSLPAASYPAWPQRLTLIERMLEDVGHHPGVSAAGVINTVPFSGRNTKAGITVKGYVQRPGESLRGHYCYGVGGDVFAALGIPLREGRFIGSADRDSRVCVVDEDFARRYWPKGGAIGQRLFLGANRAGDDTKAFSVIGVVGAVKQAELTEGQAQGAVYFPYQLRTDPNIFVIVRTGQRPELFGPMLQKIVRAIDPGLPVNDLRSMEVRIADSLIVRRSPALLAGIFAGVAVLLAALGTYGVLAFAVAQRHREIGVRMALGALPWQIGRQFLSLGLRLIAAGTLLGVLGAWGAGRAMQTVLFNVPALDFAALAGTFVVMALASFFACWLPARRAARVDPMEALRSE